MIEAIKPPLRAAKYGYLRWQAGRRARQAVLADRVVAPAPVVFLIGCGRSGTTVLGRLLEAHPDVCYMFEPYHLWAAVDPETDFVNLYHDIDGRCLMDGTKADDGAKARFGRLFLRAMETSGRQLLVEKTPINTMRLGYLEALAPGARYVHIVRDGVDVCRSIDRLSAANLYRISGKPALHQWWGVGYAKWKALARDGRAADYWAHEVDQLESHLARGAYEWLISLSEVERWRERLGSRLLELRYPTLTEDPSRVLSDICGLAEIDAPASWLAEAGSMMGPERRHDGSALHLPNAMAGAFNELQERYGFTGRATS